MRDDDGNSALVHAAARSTAEVVRRLLDAGAKINMRNDEGRTALMHAAEAGELENVRALVAAGADYNLKDDEGKTALDFAREGEYEEVTALLVAHGAWRAANRRRGGTEEEEKALSSRSPGPEGREITPRRVAEEARTKGWQITRPLCFPLRLCGESSAQYSLKASRFLRFFFAASSCSVRKSLSELARAAGVTTLTSSPSSRPIRPPIGEVVEIVGGRSLSSE